MKQSWQGSQLVRQNLASTSHAACHAVIQCHSHDFHSIPVPCPGPYVDLGQQSLRLFKKRSARHYRLAQDKLELLKEWARDYLASRASNPTDQQAQDPTQRVEDIFVQDLLAEDVVGSDVIEEPVVQAEGSEGHQEL